MKVEFHDYAVNERPVRSFDNADELLDFLRQFRTEEFASAELLADNGFRLTIGIDGDITFVSSAVKMAILHTPWPSRPRSSWKACTYFW